MIKMIDDFLNQITMYRLVLYYLLTLLGVAFIYSAIGILAFDPYALVMLIAFLIVVSYISSAIFAWAFDVTPNMESVYISALILALIINPPTNPTDLWAIGWTAVLAMASKYILAINKKHLFNPVAIAAVVMAVVGHPVSWWVGDLGMLPLVLIGGLLIVYKLRRFDVVLSFLYASLLSVVLFNYLDKGDLLLSFQATLFYSPMIFFAAIILTEPLTMPPTHNWRMVYGFIVGFIFTPLFHVGPYILTPEIAIVLGNIFSYLVSPKSKLVLTLKEKIRIAPDIYDFIFELPQQLAFQPGQYMEWTLGHQNPDSRGIRRYFTLASSPTEEELRVGVKFYRHSSTYKESMLAMPIGSEIIAGQLAGDFTLPKNEDKPIVMIAGGIGITPFRSMVKYILDTHQKRQIVLFYANKHYDDIVYQDVFETAKRELGMKVVYTVSDVNKVPRTWNGHVGRISKNLVKSEVHNYRHCTFYISGPNVMVESYRDMLQEMGIPSNHIQTDYFPGF